MEMMDKEFDILYRDKMQETEILPEEWRGQYEIAACLKDSPGKRTYLLRQKGKDAKFILKFAEKEEAAHLLEEGKLLRELSSTGGLSKFWEPETEIKDLKEENGKVFLLRNYIDGRSLAELGEVRRFTEEEICRTGISICESVMCLHRRKPPIIHRDIKPENIIIKKDGTLALIDLETAREYKKGKQEDTYFAGTRETAAPEQYGFGQSDERTDIYGIGRTLLYMMTGDYFLEDLEKAEGSRRLKKIIRQSCRFDPANRFPSAEKMILELQKCLPDHRKENRRIQWLTGMTVLLCVAVLGLTAEVVLLKRGIKNPGLSNLRENNAEPEEKEHSQSMQGRGDRLYIRGWDVTGYEQLMGKILQSNEQKDYQTMIVWCRQLISELYADEFLKTVEAEDTYYYEDGDERWEGYDIVRTGYEQIADNLAYHDRMLEENLDYLEQYKYHIAALVRGHVESTSVDQNGNLVYTPLYQYWYEGNVEDFDYSLDCLLDAIIRGIELYQSENHIE